MASDSIQKASDDLQRRLLREAGVYVEIAEVNVPLRRAHLRLIFPSQDGMRSVTFLWTGARAVVDVSRVESRPGMCRDYLEIMPLWPAPERFDVPMDGIRTALEYLAVNHQSERLGQGAAHAVAASFAGPALRALLPGNE